jgi:myo-inositol-1(or 4)-monophosphatase
MKGAIDPVTETDYECQAIIIGMIRQAFPDHGFLAEERAEEGEVGQPPPAVQAAADHAHPGLAWEADPLRPACRWIIDPLDGTSNYVHRFPYYAVSIGLECRGELVVGVIYDPTRQEMFAARRGAGATLDGRPIRVSRFDRLDHALVIASFPPGVTADSLPIKRFLKVLPFAQTIHRSGSAALNLAYIAAGRLEAFWSTSLKPWDVAAGALIVTEAGGRVTTMSGGPLDIELPDLLGSNGTGIHEELSVLLSGNIEAR